jgi:hypothetical protein
MLIARCRARRRSSTSKMLRLVFIAILTIIGWHSSSEHARDRASNDDDMD